MTYQYRKAIMQKFLFDTFGLYLMEQPQNKNKVITCQELQKYDVMNEYGAVLLRGFILSMLEDIFRNENE